MTRFTASVQSITGQELEVKAVESRDIVEQELEDLRKRVEELIDDVRLFSTRPFLLNSCSEGNCAMT